MKLNLIHAPHVVFQNELDIPYETETQCSLWCYFSNCHNDDDNCQAIIFRQSSNLAKFSQDRNGQLIVEWLAAVMHLPQGTVITFLRNAAPKYEDNGERQVMYYQSFCLFTWRLVANSPNEQQFICQWQPLHTHVNLVATQPCNWLLPKLQKTAQNYSNCDLNHCDQPLQRDLRLHHSSETFSDIYFWPRITNYHSKK